MESVVAESSTSLEKAKALRALLRDFLLPAHNDYDRAASEALQNGLQEEEVASGLPRKDSMGGARTEMVAHGMARKAEQERRVLKALLVAFGMDANLLDRVGDVNWLERVHERLGAAVPAAAWRLYCDCEPTEQDEAVLRYLAGGALHQEASKSAPSKQGEPPCLFQRHRERGRLPKTCAHLSRLIIGPLNHIACFGVPNEAALCAAAECAPLVECGAGTGYWSALLQRRGVDVVAYDARPPTSAFDNGFFHATYTEVLAGAGEELFAADPSLAATRALLIVWPNNPDARDNPHLAASAELLQPLWDASCLASYLQHGGKAVVYVGEREAQLTLCRDAQAADCGASSSRAFQEMLGGNFELARRVALPTWPYNVDDMTVWKRR